MTREIEISDLNVLLNELDKKGIDIKKAIKKGVTRTTYNCQAMAKKNAPVDTGALRANIHAEVKNDEKSVTGTVEPTMEYSVYPEYGTGQRGMASQIERPEGIAYNATYLGQEAQPYMYPAYVYQRDKLIPNIKKQLDKVLKGAK